MYFLVYLFVVSIMFFLFFFYFFFFISIFFFFFFFFFQAEDGIRDLTVTGVQTCALPICAARAASDRWPSRAEDRARPWARRRARSPDPRPRLSRWRRACARRDRKSVV